MKIDNEKFNKLKQLDRIEFQNKYNDIDRWDGISLVLSSVILLFSLLFIKLDFLFIGIVLFILSMILLIKTQIIVNNIKNKLEEEYFKVEIKK